jgi:hypothetical protein
MDAPDHAEFVRPLFRTGWGVVPVILRLHRGWELRDWTARARTGRALEREAVGRAGHPESERAFARWAAQRRFLPIARRLHRCRYYFNVPYLLEQTLAEQYQS